MNAATQEVLLDCLRRLEVRCRTLGRPWTGAMSRVYGQTLAGFDNVTARRLTEWATSLAAGVPPAEELDRRAALWRGADAPVRAPHDMQTFADNFQAGRFYLALGVIETCRAEGKPVPKEWEPFIARWLPEWQHKETA